MPPESVVQRHHTSRIAVVRKTEGVGIQVDEEIDHFRVLAPLDLGRGHEQRVSGKACRADNLRNAKGKGHPGRHCRYVPLRNVKEAFAVARDGGEAGLGSHQRG